MSQIALRPFEYEVKLQAGGDKPLVISGTLYSASNADAAMELHKIFKDDVRGKLEGFVVNERKFDGKPKVRLVNSPPPHKHTPYEPVTTWKLKELKGLNGAYKEPAAAALPYPPIEEKTNGNTGN